MDSSALETLVPCLEEFDPTVKEAGIHIADPSPLCLYLTYLFLIRYITPSTPYFFCSCMGHWIYCPTYPRTCTTCGRCWCRTIVGVMYPGTRDLVEANLRIIARRHLQTFTGISSSRRRCRCCSLSSTTYQSSRYHTPLYPISHMHSPDLDHRSIIQMQS